MELSEKLRELRKSRGLTQEELADKLYVSRTAISKWESGRGYPSVESLKQIAGFFSVSVDTLLTADQVLVIAEEDNKQQKKNYRAAVFGVTDICTSMLLFLPFFAERAESGVKAVSLFGLSSVSAVMRILLFVVVIASVAVGISEMLLHRSGGGFTGKLLWKISAVLGICTVLLFTVSLHPYAASFVLITLIIKALALVNFR